MEKKEPFCLLTNKLTVYAEANDKRYAIDTRATVAIDCLLKMQEPDATEELLRLYVVKRMIVLAGSREFSSLVQEELYKQCNKFLEGPPSEEDETAKEQIVPSKPVMDYVQDAEAIVASFWQAYGLSLEQTASLHWWVFLALLKNLPSETMFQKIVSLRTKRLPAKAPLEAKAELSRAQAKVAVKDKRTKQQKERAAQKAINALDL